MKMLPNRILFGSMFALLLATLVAGCGGGGAGGGDGDGDGGGSTSTANSIALAASSTSVQSDNSDSITITATVLDDNNLVMSNQPVQFRASTGVVIASGSSTDSNGRVTATFSSGTLDRTNRTATITVTATGSTASGTIPIQITGSALTVSAPSTSPTAGTAVTITATAKAVGTNAANQTLRFSIAPSSVGSGTLSATSATTNASGVASVNFTGTAAGTVNVLVEWLDGTGVATATATQSFNVQASGSAFQVTTPSSSPWPVTLATSQSVVVAVPATINGTAVGSLRYATTLGTWQGSAAKTLMVNGPGASDAQIFLAGSFAGNANIQIDAFSGANATGTLLATAKLVFALSASAASAQSISLQSNVYSLAPSSGGTTSTATLTATVRDAANNAVGGASVLFELVNPSGSGEQIDPVVVSTNSSGVAQSTFTAGTATNQMSQIRASVVGSAITPSTINITVGGTVGSIAIGTSTTISANDSNTGYKLPVTVMVTDSNGNAVSGATVSLSLWPSFYHKGNRPTVSSKCPANVTFTNVNEDLNENLIKDPGEDVDGPGNMTGLASADGALWPPSSAAGSVPATVITGVDGTATFDWVYLKQYADWITARLRAKALVQGSEATTTSYIGLAPSKADVDACVLPASPFN